MKGTGIVRNVDDLGRIVIPIEVRRKLGIQIKDTLEIFMDDDLIILRKYEPACILCGNDKNIKNLFGKKIVETV